MILDTPRTPDRRARRALVEVLARAFRDNPMNVAIHGPRPRRRVRANRAGLRALVLDTASELEARVCMDGDRVLGGLVAAPPEVRVLPAPALARQLGCLWHQGARAMDRWGRVSVALMQFRPLAPHWYLSVLGVDPTIQSRGVGSTLLEALRLGLDERSAGPRGAVPAPPIYLDCDRPASVAFYRARGFEVMHEIEVEGVPCWGLGHGFAPTR